MFVLVIKVRQTAGRGKIIGRGAEDFGSGGVLFA